jgi:signal transduction histidine kinase
MLKPVQLSKILKVFHKVPKANLEDPLKKAEEEQDLLWKILSRLPGGIVVLRAGVPVYLNSYALSFFGISESASLELPLPELVQKAEISAWLTKEVFSRDQGFRNKLFTVGPHTLIASLEGDPQGKNFSYFTFTDVTANWDELKEDFRTDRVESLCQLVSYLAHEIKNPLHALHLHIKILEHELKKGKETPEKIQKSLDVLSAETERLNHLTQQFLKLGQWKDRIFTPTDVNQLLESVLEVLRPDFQENNASLLTAYDKRLPKIPLLKEKMYQAFLNLAKNALEALPKKGGKLEIKTEKRENTCRIEFKDNGAGIPEENLSRIFEPYFSTKKGGSGLGLVWVRETVENHGGRIEVRAKKGEGTAFILHLPLKQEPLKLPRSSP